MDILVNAPLLSVPNLPTIFHSIKQLTMPPMPPYKNSMQSNPRAFHRHHSMMYQRFRRDSIDEALQMKNLPMKAHTSLEDIYDADILPLKEDILLLDQANGSPLDKTMTDSTTILKEPVLAEEVCQEESHYNNRENNAGPVDNEDNEISLPFIPSGPTKLAFTKVC